MHDRARAAVLTVVLVSALFLACGSEPAAPPQAPAAPPSAAPAAPDPPAMPLEAFRFAASLASPVPPAPAGALVEVPLTLVNTSAAAWPGRALAGTNRSFNASYHILGPAGENLVWDGARTPIAEEVPPGGQVAVRLKVQAPGTPGSYRVQLDLVQERIGWFNAQDTGAKPFEFTLEVVAKP